LLLQNNCQHRKNNSLLHCQTKEIIQFTKMQGLMSSRNINLMIFSPTVVPKRKIILKRDFESVAIKEFVYFMIANARVVIMSSSLLNLSIGRCEHYH
jgi:hypothetical protein